MQLPVSASKDSSHVGLVGGTLGRFEIVKPGWINISQGADC